MKTSKLTNMWERTQPILNLKCLGLFVNLMPIKQVIFSITF